MRHLDIRTILLGSAGLLLWAGCQRTVEQSHVTARVERGELVFEGEYLAEIEAAESVAVHVPKVADSWQVTVDTVEPDGTRVEEGDVVLTFVRDSLELELQDEVDKLEVARAERRKVAQSLDRERIELQLEVDRRELAVKRAELQVLEGVNFVSEVDLEKARLDVRKAKLELELARDALDAFEQKRAAALQVEDLKIEAAQRAVDLQRGGLEEVEVRAPVAGILYAPFTRLNWQRTKVAPGVVARPGDKVLEIPDLSAFHAVIYARPRDAALIEIGDEGSFYPTILPERAITVKVIEKDDFATTRNERDGTEDPAGNLKEHKIVLELAEAPDELRPGNTGRVALRCPVADDVLKIPVVAVDEREGRSYVNLADGAEREVTLGSTTLTHVEIETGLAEGDEVVVGRAPEVVADEGPLAGLLP